MLDLIVRNARLPDGDSADIAIQEGRIAELRPEVIRRREQLNAIIASRPTLFFDKGLDITDRILHDLNE